MQDDKTQFPLLHLPEELILLIASFLDKDNLLSLRLVSNLLERITQHLFFYEVNKKLGSDTIACGDTSVILMRPNGQVWGWGANWFNQLALDDYSPFDNRGPCFQPKEVGLKNVVKVAMGYEFSLAIRKDGTVFASGTNTHGELGLGDKEMYFAPNEIPVLKNATQIAAGLGFALAAKEDGTLYSWGRNDCGQLGHGHQENCLTPTVVPGIKNVDKIAVGQDFSAALTKNGALYIWGRLGLGREDECLHTPQEVATLEGVVSISAGRNFILALKNDGSVFTFCHNISEKLESIEIPDIKDIVKISTNNSYYYDGCLALSKEGTLYSWKHFDVRFQTGGPQKILGLKKIVAIGQGLNFWVALDMNGVLYSLGTNNNGQLGIGEGYDKCDTPTKVWSFEEPAKNKIQFLNTVTKRLANERFTKTFLMPAQKTPLRQDLTSFSSSNENQFEKEIEELKGIIKDESTASAAQIEDKIDSYLKIYSSAKDSPKKSFCFSLFAMKQKLSAEKTQIIEETEAEVFSHMMKRI